MVCTILAGSDLLPYVATSLRMRMHLTRLSGFYHEPDGNLYVLVVAPSSGILQDSY